jgi:putative N6-adenine-specific DNA methylase
MADAPMFEMVAKTLDGFEPLLEQELRKLGAQKITVLKRAVSFYGDTGFMYKANLWLRTALRILKPIHQFQIENQDDLYQEVKKFPWETVFPVHKQFRINATAHSEIFSNSRFLEQKTKDAVADRFREKLGERPSVSLTNPDIYIHVHLSGQQVILSLDSSGEPLHKRGYKQNVGPAPLSEVLAAGLILFADWRPPIAFFDPMCGSGTLLIEAGLIGRNLPPNIYRKSFAFMNWEDYDASLHKLIEESAFKRGSETDLRIYGSDNNGWVLDKCATNLEAALFDEEVKISEQDFIHRDPPAAGGIIIMNPPYDMKIKSNNELLYKQIGDTLKKKYAGWTAWIFTADLEYVKSIGLRASRKIKLKNGPLDAVFLKYELFEGSKKKS